MSNARTRKIERAAFPFEGPGGMNCACCAPAPGKKRRAAKRYALRRAARAAWKFEREAYFSSDRA